MANFTLPPRPERSQDSSRAVENRGDIALRVEEFDKAKNSVTGVDLATGEVMTIRMASEKEFADLYSNRNRYPSEKERADDAANQMANQPAVSKMQRDAAAPSGTVIQCQQVKQLNNQGGALIARWANAISTDPSQEFTARAQVSVSAFEQTINKGKPNESKEPRRRVTAFLIDQTVEANAQSVTAALSPVAADNGALPYEGIHVTRPLLVSVIDKEGNSETAQLWSVWDNDAKQLKTDPASVFERPANRDTAAPLAALAARLDLPVDVVKVEAQNTGYRGDIDEASVESFKQTVAQVYDAARNGDVAVTVTPGVMATATKHLSDNIIKGENDSRRVNLRDRGFFEADISLLAAPPSDDGKFGASWGMKSALASEFLVNKDHANYRNRSIRDLGNMAAEVAEKSGQVVFEPMAGANQPEVSQTAEASRDQDQDRDNYIPSGIGMDM